MTIQPEPTTTPKGKGIRETIKNLTSTERLVYFVILPFVLLIALLSVGLGGYFTQQAIVAPQPFTFDVTLPSSNQVICPDGAVHYEIDFTVYRDAVVQQVRTIWSIDEHRTVAPEREPRYYNWRNGLRIVNRIEYDITPYNLPDGNYIYYLSVTDETHTTDAVLIAVPFSVNRKECNRVTEPISLFLTRPRGVDPQHPSSLSRDRDHLDNRPVDGDLSASDPSRAESQVERTRNGGVVFVRGGGLLLLRSIFGWCCIHLPP